MDASQITKLLQKQNTRYINRCQTVDSSTLIWKNQIQSSKYIKGVKTCEGEQNTSNPANPACSDGQGICSFGGAGRTSAIQTGSPQQFLNVLSGAAGSGSQVYSSESITLQQAGKQSCGVPGTNPAPENSYVVLPACYCVNTNGPTNSDAAQLSNPSVPGNATITGNPNNLPVNNQSNPYLPPFDTYYRFKNPAAQCGYPIQDQNQKYFVTKCFKCPSEMGYSETAIEPTTTLTPQNIVLNYILPDCPSDQSADYQIQPIGSVPFGGSFFLTPPGPAGPGEVTPTINPVTGVITIVASNPPTSTPGPQGLYIVTYSNASLNLTITWQQFMGQC